MNIIQPSKAAVAFDGDFLFLLLLPKIELVFLFKYLVHLVPQTENIVNKVCQIDCVIVSTLVIMLLRIQICDLPFNLI